MSRRRWFQSTLRTGFLFVTAISISLSTRSRSTPPKFKDFILPLVFTKRLSGECEARYHVIEATC